MAPSASSHHLGPFGRFVEVARPCALFALFVVCAARFPWWATLPAGVLAVFAWSILVHDLIHNALRLPPRVNDVALALSALFLLKSGHGLRVLHVRHHRECLESSDGEGRVAFDPWLGLLVRGPWLALDARRDAWRSDTRTRSWQVVETALDLAVLGGLAAVALALRHPAPIVYWASVVAVTVTAPIWGAKIPHMVPYRSRWVQTSARLTGRLTPAIASVLLHELHHRRPGLPVALLPSHRRELEATTPSDCSVRFDAGRTP